MSERLEMPLEQFAVAVVKENERLRAQNAELAAALRGVMYRGEYSKHCACPDCDTARAALSSIETPTASAAENTDD